MKTIFTILTLFLVHFASAQTDLEDRDDSFILENNKNIQKIEIEKPFYQIPVKCENFTPASFNGGADAYGSVLKKNMYTFLNTNYYTLNGVFTFTLTIDQSGKVTTIGGAPKIHGSDVFFDDMKYVVRRIQENWNPAQCDGKPVTSQMKIKIDFSSTIADM